VLISILKVWEINQNKGITVPIHKVHQIIIELFPQMLGLIFLPSPPFLLRWWI